ncbi:hypothetical protein F0M18_02790 [Pseudohalioglobus sediminis]|uniref:Uncharacterized protein n=1 Tax=Pseudohalioglobus sediminis TaxID=2606449 RepID=A0A5B0X4V9_9GAMM|nr:hypothetical protein [Pseudohalioglobus sediminis]KAA1194374.1 hypothetical protein F0M18_02790 [Pseudohalioglobus sediminis]
MSIKPRRNVLIHSDERVLVYAGLFFICAVLAALGVGALAFWCFLPAAVLMECLSAVAPQQQSRRL